MSTVPDQRPALFLAETATTGAPAWRALVVDDEPLARLRLRQLLVELAAPLGCCAVLEAGSAAEALAWPARLAAEAGPGPVPPLALVFIDIQMLGLDGLQLAAAWPLASHRVFVSAHAQHALQAFELGALDYLAKPVSRERLARTVARALATPPGATAATACATRPALQVPQALQVDDRGGSRPIALDEVVYVRAELKYLTVRTEQRNWLMSASLQDLAQRFPQHFVRVHRNALVSVPRLRALRAVPGAGGLLSLRGVDESLAVSRRQLPVVREKLARLQAAGA
ncbi:MAG: LytR domain-containing response regulator [Comamonas sp.]